MFNVAETQRVCVYGTDSLLLGKMTPSSNVEIRHIILALYKKGSGTGNETIQLKIHSSKNTNIAIAQSNVIPMNSVTSDTNFYGFVRFDFDRTTLNQNRSYFLSVTLQNYTRDGDNFYISFPLNYDTDYFSSGRFDSDPNNPFGVPAEFKVFGFQK